MARSRLVIAIDGSNWLHADWHADPKQAVFYFASRVEMIGKKFPNARVVVAFDRRSFRHDLDANYKAHRPAKPPDLLDAIADAERACYEREIDVAAHDGFEADDVLASIAAQHAGKVMLCSGDKDLFQVLESGRVTIARKVRKENGSLRCEWYSADNLLTDTGLTPSQYRDAQVLMGDSGDNIPGIEGVGEKTAYKIIQAAGSLDNVAAKLWSLPISEKIRDRLIAFLPLAEQVKSLVILRRDVPLTCLLD